MGTVRTCGPSGEESGRDPLPLPDLRSEFFREADTKEALLTRVPFLSRLTPKGSVVQRLVEKRKEIQGIRKGVHDLRAQGIKQVVPSQTLRMQKIREKGQAETELYRSFFPAAPKTASVLGALKARLGLKTGLRAPNPLVSVGAAAQQRAGALRTLQAERKGQAGLGRLVRGVLADETAIRRFTKAPTVELPQRVASFAEGFVRAASGSRTPSYKTLEKSRVPLTPVERSSVMRQKATWHHGPDGAPSPAIWKSVVKGKTYYGSNTHRTWSASKDLQAAVGRFRKHVEPSS